jgi:hypothetical protein
MIPQPILDNIVPICQALGNTFSQETIIFFAGQDINLQQALLALIPLL